MANDDRTATRVPALMRTGTLNFDVPDQYTDVMAEPEEEVVMMACASTASEPEPPIPKLKTMTFERAS